MFTFGSRTGKQQPLAHRLRLRGPKAQFLLKPTNQSFVELLSGRECAVRVAGPLSLAVVDVPAVPAMWWHGIGSGLEGSITGRFAGGPVGITCHSVHPLHRPNNAGGWLRWLRAALAVQARAGAGSTRHAIVLFVSACMHASCVVWSLH